MVMIAPISIGPFGLGPLLLPGQVGGVATTVISSTIIDVSWNVTAGADKYVVERRLLGGADTTVLTTTALWQRILGLSPSTAYEFRVQAINIDGEGGWSPWVGATTLAAPALPPTYVDTGGSKWRFGVDLISPTTRDVLAQDIDVESVSVNWAYRAVDPTHSVDVVDSTPRRTGQMVIRHDPEFNPLAVWYRPWIEELQGDLTWKRDALGTFTAARMPGVTRDSSITMRTIPIAEVSVRYVEHRLTAPLALEPGTNILQWIADDLQLRFGDPDASGLTPSPKTLGENEAWDHDWMAFDVDTPMIDVYDRLLAYIGYEPLYVNRLGEPIAHPARDFEQEPVRYTYGGSGRGISPEVQISPVTPEIPNVIIFRARNGPSLSQDGNGQRVVRNEDTGPGSITQRGRVVFGTVTVDADSQDELDAIARFRAPRLFAGGGWTMDATARATPELDDSVIADITHTVGATGRWLISAYGFAARAGQESAIVDMSLQAELIAGSAFASDTMANPPAVSTTGVAYRGVAQ